MLLVGNRETERQRERNRERERKGEIEEKVREGSEFLQSIEVIFSVALSFNNLFSLFLWVRCAIFYLVSLYFGPVLEKVILIIMDSIGKMFPFILIYININQKKSSDQYRLSRLSQRKWLKKWLDFDVQGGRRHLTLNHSDPSSL